MSPSRFSDGLRYRIEIPSIEVAQVLGPLPDLPSGEHVEAAARRVA